MHFSSHNRVYAIFALSITLFAVLTALGVSQRKTFVEYRYQVKMGRVVDEAIRRAPTSKEKSAFENGKIFVNIEGLGMPLVGVTVPLTTTGRRAHVLFTAEYFNANSVATLAQNALEDFHRAEASQL